MACHCSHESCGEDESKPSEVWVPEIVENIVRYLSRNEIPCTIRLVDRAAAAQFRHLRKIHLSLPSPPAEFQRHWGAPGATRSLTLAQRHKLLALTAATGVVANLEFAAQIAGCTLRSEVMEAAAASGQLNSCEWLLAQNCPCDWGAALTAAALEGRQAACSWLIAKGCPNTICFVLAAGRGGHVGLMHWLLTRLRSRPFSSECLAFPLKLLAAAAEGFSLPDLQRLSAEEHLEQPLTQQPQAAQQLPQQLQQWSLERAVEHSLLAVVLAGAAQSPTPDWQAKIQWLESRYAASAPAMQRYGMCEAAAAVQPDAEALARLRWLRGSGYSADTQATWAAAVAGNVSALRYLLGKAGVRPDFLVPAKAFAAGQLGALQVLHEHGVDLRPAMHIAAAASRGHRHVVAWAVEELGVDVAAAGKALAVAAARSGDLELAAWLAGHGCDFARAEVFVGAAGGGSEAMMEWLVGLGCPLPSNDSVYVNASSNGDLATLRCLRRLGCPWSDNTNGGGSSGPTAAAAAGSIFARCVAVGCSTAALHCLLQLGCQVDWAEALGAVERRRERAGDGDGAKRELSAWLLEERNRRGVDQ